MGGELDVDEAARRELEVPETGGRTLALHQRPHLTDVAGAGLGIARTAQLRLDRILGRRRETRRTRPHHPRAGQGQELPGLGRALVIALEGAGADRHRARGARRTQLQVDLVEPAFGRGSGEGGDQPLGEAAVEGLRTPALDRRGRRRVLGAIEGHQIEIRAGGHLARAALAQGHHRHLAREGAGQALDFRQGGWRQGADAGVGQPGEGGPGFLGAGHGAHHLHADAEGLFAMHAPDRVHGVLETAGRRGRLLDRPHVFNLDGREEVGIEQGVERGRPPREGAGELGGIGQHPDQQVEQPRLGQQQRLHLDARGEAREEVDEAVEGDLRRARGLGRFQQTRR